MHPKEPLCNGDSILIHLRINRRQGKDYVKRTVNTAATPGLLLVFMFYICTLVTSITRHATIPNEIIIFLYELLTIKSGG